MVALGLNLYFVLFLVRRGQRNRVIFKVCFIVFMPVTLKFLSLSIQLSRRNVRLIRWNRASKLLEPLSIILVKVTPVVRGTRSVT